MSGDQGRLPSRRRSALLAFVMLLVVGTAQAGFPDLIEDPLMTRPPALESGVVLPGDDEPLACPPRIDLEQPLALSDAVDLVLCNNPQIKATWAAIKIQVAALGEARSTYLPTLTASVSSLRTTTRYPDVPAADTTSRGQTRYGSLAWRLFDFGGRAANLEAANQSVVAALATHDATLQKSMASVIGAYFDAMTAQAAWAARTMAAELAQATLATTQRREAKGMAALSDTLQAGTALAKARLEAHRAEGEARKSLAVLVYAMGLPTTTQLLLPNTLGDYRPEMVDDLAHWITDAEARHPAIAAARAQWEAAKAKVDAARSDGLPTVDFTGNDYQNGYPNQALQTTRTNVATIGISVTIPLFEGFSRTYKIRGAQAQTEQSEAQWQDTEHQVLTDVIKAHADAVSALGNLQASEALIDAARDSVASSQKRYDKGAADVLELLTTQAALADAQQERVRCLAEWRSARLRLMASAGLLGLSRVDSVGRTER